MLDGFWIFVTLVGIVGTLAALLWPGHEPSKPRAARPRGAAPWLATAEDVYGIRPLAYPAAAWVAEEAESYHAPESDPAPCEPTWDAACDTGGDVCGGVE